MAFLTFSLLTTVRITALVFSAPLLGHRAVAWWIRLGLGLVLSIFAISAADSKLWSLPLTTASGSAGLFGGILAEAAIGLMLGLGISLLLSAGELMGECLSQMAGLGVGAETTDDEPNNAAVRLIGLLTIVLFVLARGPESVIASLLGSLREIPVGSRPITADSLTLLGDLMQQSLELAVRGASPAIAAMLAATAAVGLAQRVMPDVGLGLAGPGVGLAAFAFGLYLTVSAGLWLIDGHWPGVQEKVWEFLKSKPT